MKNTTYEVKKSEALLKKAKEVMFEDTTAHDASRFEIECENDRNGPVYSWLLPWVDEDCVTHVCVMEVC